MLIGALIMICGTVDMVVVNMGKPVQLLLIKAKTCLSLL